MITMSCVSEIVRVLDGDGLLLKVEPFATFYIHASDHTVQA